MFNLWSFFFVFRKWTELCGAACVTTSADDMGQFMKLLLNDGVTESGKRLVGHEEMKDMFRSWNIPRSSSLDKYFSVIKGVPYSREYTGYALGLKRGFYRSTDICFFLQIYDNLIFSNSMDRHFVFTCKIISNTISMFT